MKKINNITKLPNQLLVAAHTLSAKTEEKTNDKKLQVGTAGFLSFSALASGSAFAAPGDIKGGNTLIELAQTITGYLLLLVGVAIVAMLAWGALMFTTASGAQDRARKAKETVKNVAIGTALGASIFILRGLVLDTASVADSGGQGNNLRKQLESEGTFK